jgi:hypothetical protein
VDVQLAHTFLEVIAAGSFVGAAKRLNISQADVSMRIQALEDVQPSQSAHQVQRESQITQWASERP